MQPDGVEVQPGAAHQIALASLANAREYEAQASLCLERQWFGRAAALAVLGQEEAGKSVYFWMVSVGAMRLKSDAVRVLSSKHVPKQQLGAAVRAGADAFDWAVMATALAAALEPLRDAADGAARSPANAADLVRESISRIAAALTADPHGVSEFVERMRASSTQLAGLNLSRVKEAGLYVEFRPDSGAVSSPQEQPDSVAKPQVESLRATLVMLTDIYEAVPADRLDDARQLCVPLVNEAVAMARARDVDGAESAQPRSTGT